MYSVFFCVCVAALSCQGIHTVCHVLCGGSFGDCVLHRQQCSVALLDISLVICQFMPLCRHFFSYLSVVRAFVHPDISITVMVDRA